MDTVQLVLVSLALCAAAFATGVLVAEWRARASVVADYRAANAQLSETLKKLNEAHNSIAKRLEEIQDQVNSHEFKITAKVPK